MHKVFQVDGGYQIFWCPSHPKHYTDKVPASERIYRQKQAAYRRCKQLNDERANQMFRSRNLVTNESTYHETREQAIDANHTAHCRGGIVKVESQSEDGNWSQTTEDFEESYKSQLNLSLTDKLRRAGRLPE